MNDGPLGSTLAANRRRSMGRAWRLRRTLGHGGAAGSRPARQREPAAPAQLRCAAATGSTRSSFIPAYHAPHAGQHGGWPACLDLGRADSRARPARPARARPGFSPSRAWRAGHVCPLTMTHASVGGARGSSASGWPNGCRRSARGATIPASSRSGRRRRTLGMGMTEKQGGTDVRANTTRAVDGGRRICADRP